jgi:hypothetical protein
MRKTKNNKTKDNYNTDISKKQDIIRTTNWLFYIKKKKKMEKM